MPIKPAKRPSADQIAVSIIALIEAARKEDSDDPAGLGDNYKVESYKAVVDYLTQVVHFRLQGDTAKMSPGERVHIRRSGALYREAIVTDYQESDDPDAPKTQPSKKFKIILEGHN